MNNTSWFMDALQFLERNYRTDVTENVDGLSVFVEFLNESPPNVLKDMYSDYDSEDRVDEFMRDNFDSYLKWVNEQPVSWISIGKRNNWSLAAKGEKAIVSRSKVPNLLSEESVFNLSYDDKSLLSKDWGLLNNNDAKLALDLYQRSVSASDDDELIADISHRVARIFDDMDVAYTVKADYWEVAGKRAEAASQQDAYKWYVKSAEIHSMSMQYIKSAKLYEKSASLLGGQKRIDKQQDLLELLRSSRRQYEALGERDHAARMYIQECNTRLNSADKFDWFALFLYRLLSNYGEAPIRVGVCALIAIGICTILYWCLGIHASVGETPVFSFFTSLYYSVVTFTTLGYGDYSPAGAAVRLISAIEAMTGLLLTSLFMVTVVRKYSR